MKELKYLYDPIIARFLILVPIYLTNTTNFGLVTSIRFAVTLSCDFDFSSYPFDENTCPFRLETESPGLKLRYRADQNKGMDYRHSPEGFFK